MAFTFNVNPTNLNGSNRTNIHINVIKQSTKIIIRKREKLMSMTTPIYLATDFYKLSHREQYPEGTTKVYSTLTPRSNKYAP